MGGFEAFGLEGGNAGVCTHASMYYLLSRWFLSEPGRARGFLSSTAVHAVNVIPVWEVCREGRASLTC